MKTGRKIGIALLGIVVVGVVVSFTLFGGSDEEYEFFTTEVARGTIQNTVAATGALQPVVNVQVGSQVSGQIQTLYADFNTIVRAGQPLAKIDPRNLETQLENAQANLVSARARIQTAEADLVNAHAGVESSQANLASARAEAEKAAINQRRSEELAASDLVSQNDLEIARVSLESARARLAQAEASLKQAEVQIISREAGIAQARAQVVQAEAQVNQARVNLEYTDITSPVDGVVISREVDVGQTVAASMSAPLLFLIANDLSQMRVIASVDEADIGLLAESNDVEFSVDAFPNERFTGTIEEIRLNPQTTQNVVTYNVIVAVSNPDLKLKPGMTANITVTVDRRDNVLRVPNAALRYNPPDVDPAELRQTLLEGRGARGGFASQAIPADDAAESDSVATEADDASVPRQQAFAGSGRRPRAGTGDRFRGRGGFPGGLPEGFPGPEAPGSGTRTTATGSDPAPGQLFGAGEKLQFQKVAPVPPRPGQVWILTAEGVPEIRMLMLGITDGSRSEVVSGDVREGNRVIIGDSSLGDAAPDNGGRVNPQIFRMIRGGGGFGGGRR